MIPVSSIGTVNCKLFGAPLVANRLAIPAWHVSPDLMKMTYVASPHRQLWNLDWGLKVGSSLVLGHWPLAIFLGMAVEN